MNEQVTPKTDVELYQKLVSERIEKSKPEKPYDESAEPGVDVFQKDQFIKRIVCTGHKLYLGMLKTNGTLPGKTDLYEAANEFTEGMSEKTKVLFYLCAYEAMASSNFDFMMKGKMDKNLATAAGCPKIVQEPMVYARI